MTYLQLLTPRMVGSLDSVVMLLLVVFGSLVATGGMKRVDAFVTSQRKRKTAQHPSNANDLVSIPATMKYRRPSLQSTNAKPPKSSSQSATTRRRQEQHEPWLQRQSSDESLSADDSTGSSSPKRHRRSRSTGDILPGFEFLGPREVMGNRRRIKSANDAQDTFGDFQLMNQKRCSRNFLRRGSIGKTLAPTPPLSVNRRRAKSAGDVSLDSIFAIPRQQQQQEQRLSKASPLLQAAPRTSRRQNKNGVVQLLFHTDDML